MYMVGPFGVNWTFSVEINDTLEVLETNVDEVWLHKRRYLPADTTEDDQASLSTDADSAFIEKEDESDNEETSLYTTYGQAASKFRQKTKEAERTKEKGNFVFTNYFREAERKGIKNHIIITGLPGSGKSTIAIKCAEHLREKLQFDKEAKIEQSFSDLNYKGKQIIVIDGQFNQISFDIQVKKFISKIVTFAQSTSVLSRIILVFQKEILNLLLNQNKNHYLFQHFKIIDISCDEESYALNDDERKRILKSYVVVQEKDQDELIQGSKNLPSFPKCCRELVFSRRKSLDDFQNISIGVLQNHFQSMTLACKVILCGTAMRDDGLPHIDLQPTSEFRDFLICIFEQLDELFEKIPSQILNDIAKAFEGVYLSYTSNRYVFINRTVSEAVHRMLFAKNKWRYIEMCSISRLCVLSSDICYKSELKGLLLKWIIKRFAKELKCQTTESLFSVLWNLISWMEPEEESAVQDICAIVRELDWIAQKLFFEMMPKERCKKFLSKILLSFPCLKYNRPSRTWGLSYVQESTYENLFDLSKLCSCLYELYISYRSSDSYSVLHFLGNFVERAHLKKHTKNCLRFPNYESGYQIFASDILPCGMRFSNCKTSMNLDKMCIMEKKKVENVLTKDSIRLLNSYTLENSSEEFSDTLLDIGEEKKENWYIRCAILFGSVKWRKRICSELFNRKKFSTKIIVEEIKNLYINCFSDMNTISHAFCGYRFEEGDTAQRGIDTIVMVISDTKTSPLCSIRSNIAGLDVILRKENEVNGEAKDVLLYETKKSRHPSLSSKAVGDLFQHHSNITVLNMSSVRSSGYKNSKCNIERSNCVVIHCQVKGIIPFGEIPFPKFIEGYGVDVREATCKFALDPLRIGMKIANHNRNEFGTLGGFIDSTGTFNKMFLTCAHVVCPIATLLQDDSTIEVGRHEVRVFDGKDDNENEPVGVVEKVSFQLDDSSKVSVDAALIGVINRDPVDGKFAEVYEREQIFHAGFSETSLPAFKYGKIETISDDNFRNDVIKVGAKTGLTIGSLKYENSCARLVHHDLRVRNNVMRILCNQYEISPRTDSSITSDTKQLFIDEGDSGALVFIVKNSNPALLKCIGMAVAFTSYGSGIVTPIKSIFEDLGLPQYSFTAFEAQDEDQNALASILAEIRTGFTNVNQRFEKVDSDIASIKTSLQLEVRLKISLKDLTVLREG